MKLREFLRKTMILGTLALGAMPVLPLLFAYFWPQLLSWVPVYTLAFLGLSIGGLLTPGKWRLAWAIPVTLGLGVLCFFLAPAGAWFPVMAGWAVYGFLFLWSLQLGRWERDDELPPLVSLGLLGVQLFGQLLLFGDSMKPQPILASCAFLLKGSFLGFLLLTVLGLNRGSMNEASGDKRSVTQTMRRKNIWMTLGLFGLGVAASCIPYIYEWIRGAVIWVVAAVLWLLSRLLPSDSSGESGGSGGGMGGFPPAEETEPSLFLRILEVVMMVVAAIVLLLLVFWLCRKLYRVAKKLLRMLWARLEKYAATVSEDYVDEITDTRETGEGSRTRSRWGKSRPKAPKGATPEERVRYRYKLLLWKHPEWNRGATAREKLPEEAASIYERARYSPHPVTEEEAEAFRTMQN